MKATLGTGRTASLAHAALFAALGLFTLAPAARAQVSLDGTYIDYVTVGANGAFNIGSATTGQSMRYSETGAAPYTCDAFAPGNPVDELTVEATSGATTAHWSNTGTPTTAITTVSGPTVAGSTIVWQGRVNAAPFSFTVDEIYTLNDAGRFVQLDVFVTNTGATALSNVYYMRNVDPDIKGCAPDNVYSTVNDVLRQPPASSTALLVAGSAPGLTPAVVLGMGACDNRARAHVGVQWAFNNTDASGTWAAPRDPNGLNEDSAVALVARENALAAGATTAFRFVWVWGPDAATVTTRFDAGTCAMHEGDPCVAGGAVGSWHGGACCTTCWGGAACMPGTAADACGLRGQACVSCNDGNVCTTDTCTTGSCGHAVAAGGPCDDGWYCTMSDTCNASGVCSGVPRPCDDGLSCTADSCDEASDACVGTPMPGFCAIDLACVAGGTPNPASSCQVCDPARSGTAWSPVSVGTPCDDGRWCTTFDACNAAGACAGGPRDCADLLACTLDSCDEATDSCVYAASAGTCFIDGACYGVGANNPLNICQICDPSVGAAAWSPAPAGRACNDGLFCTLVDVCGGDGSCIGSGNACDDSRACTIDSCNEPTDSCDRTIEATSCLIAGACVASGTPQPGDPCGACVPTTSQIDWSPVAAGTLCGDPSCTDGMLTPAPTCSVAGDCTAGAATACSSGACRDATACAGGCTADDECPADQFCAGDPDGCVPDRMAGDACDRTAQCASGFCVDGACCATACDGTCESCGLAGDEGACTPYPAGRDPEDECPDGTCNGAGACGGADADAGDAGEDVPDNDGTGDAADAAVDGGDTGASSGCGCRASGTPAPLGLLGLALGLLGLLALRRRR